MLWPVKPLNRHYSVPSSDKEAGSMEVWSMLDSLPTAPPSLAPSALTYGAMLPPWGL